MSSEGSLRDGNAPDLKLIETFRWQPEAGCVRRERHLGRLAGSARALGFSFPRARIDAALDALKGDAPLRIRLTLARQGEVSVETQPFAPTPADAVWRLRIAKSRLRSTDALLRHKTTRRDPYDAARAEFSPSEADEVILLNERGEVCEGAITTVFVDMGDGGRLLTPGLACGLLSGVLRASLTDAGSAVEAVVSPADLQRARAIFVGNSLRGLVKACLTEDTGEPVLR